MTGDRSAYCAYSILSTGTMSADPADPESTLEQTDLVPELSHQPHVHEPKPQHHDSAPTYPLSRQLTGSSHVHIGFFDPEGVEQLRRRLSRQSESESQSRVRLEASRGHGQKHRRHSVSSEVTLVMTDGSFDLEKTLRNVMRKYVHSQRAISGTWLISSLRLDESDIKRRELGVSFQDLRVVGLGASASYQETLGSSLNPLNLLRKLQGRLHPETRDLISGFDGVVRPGEMLCEYWYFADLYRVYAKARG